MKKPYLLNLLIASCIILAALILLSRAANATVHQVSVADLAFSPPSMNVIVGDTIQWFWVSGNHTTTSDSVPAGAATWNSNINSTTPIFNYIVTQPGTYNYHCALHAQMTGTFTATVVGISEASAGPTFNWFISDNEVTISLNLASASALNIRLYNIVGKMTTTFASLTNVQGFYKGSFSLTLIPKGIYLLEVAADKKSTVQRIIVE
jgi:plastocyanin